MRRASFRGIEFDWTSMGREGGREVQKHVFPDRVDPKTGAATSSRKPEIDDTARKIREFSGVAVFTGDDADARAAAFWDAVEQSGPGRFVHPVYGEMQAVCETGSETRGGADVYYVEIQCRFIEHGAATLSVRVSPAAAVAEKAAAARKSLTDYAEAAMAPCRTNVVKAAQAVGAVESSIDDALGALKTVADPEMFQPVVSRVRGVMGSADVLVLAPADLANAWVGGLEGLLPVNLLAAAAAAYHAPLATGQAWTVAARDVISLSAAIEAARLCVDEPGDNAREATDLARRMADTLRELALGAATPEVHGALMELAGAAAASLQESAGRLPQVRTVDVPAAMSLLVLAGDLYPDDPEAGAREILANTRGVSGLFVPAGTVEVVGG